MLPLRFGSIPNVRRSSFVISTVQPEDCGGLSEGIREGGMAGEGCCCCWLDLCGGKLGEGCSLNGEWRGGEGRAFRITDILEIPDDAGEARWAGGSKRIDGDRATNGVDPHERSVQRIIVRFPRLSALRWEGRGCSKGGGWNPKEGKKCPLSRDRLGSKSRYIAQAWFPIAAEGSLQELRP